MTGEEKEIVTALARHLAAPPAPGADDMDVFWWDYGADQVAQDLPWGDDPDRASYLYRVALRYAGWLQRAST